MPLDPKQLPPYYTIGTTTPPSGGALIRIYANTTKVPTVSTTETNFYVFNIPADTLEENGDSVKIKFIGVTEGSGSFNTKLYIKTVLANFIDTIAAGGQQWEIEIVKTGTTTAVVYYWEQLPGTSETQVQELTALDFTIANEIKFTGQSGDPTILRSWGVTMDKYKII